MPRIPAYPLPEADVVVANIALRPILRLAERWRLLRRRRRLGTAPPASCCSPGLLVEQAEEALAAFPALRRGRAASTTAPGSTLHLDEAGDDASVARPGFVGCKVSQADGEEALAGLAAAGLEPVTAREAADVVVVHTCCVTAEAERKSRRLVRRAASAGRLVVVAGCAAALRPEQFEGEGVTVAAQPRLGGTWRANLRSGCRRRR